MQALFQTQLMSLTFRGMNKSSITPSIRFVCYFFLFGSSETFSKTQISCDRVRYVTAKEKSKNEIKVGVDVGGTRG